MAHFVAFFISFQKTFKIPPGGEQGLLAAQGLLTQFYEVHYKKMKRIIKSWHPSCEKKE